MRHSVLILLLWFALSGSVLAQADVPIPVPGDPPRVALIRVQDTGTAGEVEVIGDSNAVFPTATVAVRNLYTQDTVYTQASITGAFSARIFGAGTTPFLISPVQGAVTPAVQARPGSLSGGPAAIVWGTLPQQVGEGARFTLAGALGQSGRWTAEGRADRLNIASGDTASVRLELDVRLNIPRNVTLDYEQLRFTGLLDLLPVAVRTGDDVRAVSSMDTNNGWSSVQTVSGLAIDDIGGTLAFAQAAAQGAALVPSDGDLTFRLAFDATVPDGIRDGLYVPVLRPLLSVGEAPAQPWDDNMLFGTADMPMSAPYRLPLVLNVGGVEDAVLPMPIVWDDPSDGARGILPDDASEAALSNRVRLNPPTYILALTQRNGDPATISLEPYLPQMLANSYSDTLPPLLPLANPSGSVSVRVRAPNGTSTDIGPVDIVQGAVGTRAADERSVFGRQSPVDAYQLTTLDPALRGYPFSGYGEYAVDIDARLADVFGNTYLGGGTYRFLVAEQFDMTPLTLPGTPFERGDAVNVGLRIAPAAEAEVRVRAILYPLDGRPPVETMFEGRASRGGVFQPSTPLTFDEPGEYVLEYEARYTDGEQRLWAGSYRSAGVVASGQREYTAHGERGLYGADSARRQAWFRAERTLATAPDLLLVRAPYFSGDVAWLEDEDRQGIAPFIRLQDVLGGYSRWLLADVETDSPFEQALLDSALTNELPLALLTSTADPYNPARSDALVSDSYAYVSVVRPNVTLRQFVSGSVLPHLPVWTDMDDPVNAQIGAGFEGAQPGDYFFMFGAAVLRNPEIEVENTSIYGSVGIVTEAGDALAARVAPPGRGADGAADAGPLLVLPDAAYDAFFVPTGVQPGDILALGETLAVSGQAAPALPVTVDVSITAPGGGTRAFSGRANAVGYFYDPTQDIVVDEAGLWTIDVRVTADAATSSGVTAPPYPVGGIPGSPTGRFYVYVVDDASIALTRDTRADLSIPSALPYNFAFTVPEGWSVQSVEYTLRTDGYLLEQGTVRVSGRSFSYQYNPTSISRRFPNQEVEARVDGAAVSDVKALTFFVRATDETGASRWLYRVYHILHDRLVSLEEGGES